MFFDSPPTSLEEEYHKIGPQSKAMELRLNDFVIEDLIFSLDEIVSHIFNQH